jgi:dienelactone hydrolase
MTMLAVLVVVLLPASASFAQGRDVTYRTVRPDGAGPHPAVIFLSGCDGFTPSIAPRLYDRRADQFRALGHIVVFADYLGRRGLKTCAGPVTHDDAARDLVAAATWVKSQPGVDRARVSAVGWSYGGRAVLVALAKQPVVARAIVFYPDCRALEPWTSPVPVLMLLGGDDTMTPAQPCQDAVKKATSVRVVVYPGAMHAFDVSELPPKMSLGLGTIGYHPAAAAAAWSEVERFVTKK